MGQWVQTDSQSAKQDVSMLKQLALKLTPRPLLLLLKKQHYFRVLKDVETDAEPELEVVKGILRAGSVAIDIGANMGLYTVAMSRWVGDRGRVYSIEPIPDTYELLTSSIRKLGLKNVETFQMALSDRADMLTMVVPKFDGGGENYYRAHLTNDIEEKTKDGLMEVEVEVHPLDEVAAAWQSPVRFVKCDVEGHERKVIKGAERLIAEFKPACLVEIAGDPDERGSSAAEIVSYFEGLGYGAYLLESHQLKMRRVGDRAINYFFLMPEHVRELGEVMPPLVEGLRAKTA